MSVEVSALVWNEFKPAELKTSAGKTVSGSVCKLVLLALADYASDDGSNVYPSIDTISSKTLLARRTVINALDALRTAGVLVVDERGSRYGTNEYRILKDEISTLTNSDGGDSAPGALPWCTQCTSDSAPSALNPLVNPLVNPLRSDEQNSLIACARVVDNNTPQPEPAADHLEQTRQTMERLAARGGVGADWAILSGRPAQQQTPEQALANEQVNAANRYPPDIRPLAVAYMTATGHVLQLQHLSRDARAFREMRRDGVTPDILSATVALMRRQGLAITAPHSVTGMARDQAAQQAQRLAAPPVPDVPEAVDTERVAEGKRRLEAIFAKKI